MSHQQHLKIQQQKSWSHRWGYSRSCVEEVDIISTYNWLKIKWSVFQWQLDSLLPQDVIHKWPHQRKCGLLAALFTYLWWARCQALPPGRSCTTRPNESMKIHEKSHFLSHSFHCTCSGIALSVHPSMPLLLSPLHSLAGLGLLFSKEEHFSRLFLSHSHISCCGNFHFVLHSFKYNYTKFVLPLISTGSRWWQKDNCGLAS